MKERMTTFLVLLLLFGAFGSIMIPDAKGEDLYNPGLQVEPGKNMNISQASSTHFYSEIDSGYAGTSLTYAGDLNGDGIDDVVIPSTGYPANGAYSGKVYILFGSYEGFSGAVNLSSADASFLGEEMYDAVGTSLAGLGDINGDGFDDLAIGSTQNDEGGTSAGKVYLIFGKASGWENDVELSDLNSTIIGTQSGFFLGTTMSTAGDVNGDGLSDFILGNYRSKALLFYGNSSMSRWDSVMDDGDADTIFEGETYYDYTGEGVSGGGDLNNDGYSDIVVAATKSNDAGSYAGKVHIFFGKPGGFDAEVSAASSDASFLGEGVMNMTGKVSYCRGDVNSDGFDDILVSSTYYGVGGGYRGKTYLILGKAQGWSHDVSLSDADASWIGEDGTDYSGCSVSMIGDHDSDGYDDILIGAYFANRGDEMPGKAYLIKGRSSGWERNVSLSQIPISLVGETHIDYLGKSIANAGDINGDGTNDILVSAPYNDAEGPNRGKVYMINSMRSYDPEQVYSVRIYDDPLYTNIGEYLDRGGVLYIQLNGKDGNTTNTDTTRVNISMEWKSYMRIPVALRETGPDTGIYRGRFIVPLDAEYKQNITVISVVDATKSTKVMAHTPVLMMPLEDVTVIEQDEPYYMRYWNFGHSSNLQWSMTTDADWLYIYMTSGELKGTPANQHVGKYQVRIDVTDGKGNHDFREFELVVKNREPIILTEDILSISQDDFYYVDYDSNEDDTGMVSWHYLSQANWLTLDPDSGELFGTPTNDDTGEYIVSVWVDDGNGGSDTSDFTVNVTNVNDPPTIVTEDVTVLEQGDNFKRDYDAEDIDWRDEHIWTLETDAAWLSMNEKTGVLSGIPGPLDIGVFDVLVRVTDNGGLFDQHEFKLVVNNVNDPPELVHVPYTSDIAHGEQYTFDVNGSDIDGEDGLVYSLTTSPNTDMTIDPETGVINWKASIDWFIGNSKRLKVKVILSDGEFKDNHEFEINVIPSTPPISSLTSPEDGVKISKGLAVLSWSGYDVEGDDITYDVYIGETKAFVESLKEDTLYLEGFSGTESGLEGLETGKTYFWIVIPHDGCSYGTCSTGVKSFTLNNPPTIKDVGINEAEVGKVFKLLLVGEDEDDERRDLRFELIGGPEGMTIDEGSGLIKWEPGKEDIMLHQATISITDGIDTTVFEMNIDVIETTGETGSSGSIVAIAGAGFACIILIAIAVIGWISYTRKKRSSEEVEDVSLEDAFPEEQEEEVRAGPASSKYSSVTISANEAHLRDKAHHNTSYESLYGKPRPEAEKEGMTTRELKEFIGKKITELENIEE